jgi:phosphoglycolate phosphatase
MYKLVIFDCDGVLFDSWGANQAYYNHLLAHFSCPPMTEAELEYVHIHNVKDSLAYIFAQHKHISKAAVDSYAQSLDYSPFLQHMIMAPDLIEFLDRISPSYHRAISTNRTTSMDRILDIFGLRKYFAVVMTAATAPRPKPAPDALYIILKHFGLEVQDAVFIGDSTVDRDHCAAVGMDLIAFKNPQLEAKWHVNSFMEILRLPPFAALHP